VVDPQAELPIVDSLFADRFSTLEHAWGGVRYAT
jgi:hypothetical protein